MYVCFPNRIAESEAYRDKKANPALHKAIQPYVDSLIAKADEGLQLGPYSVTFKTRSIRNEPDKRWISSHNYEHALI